MITITETTGKYRSFRHPWGVTWLLIKLAVRVVVFGLVFAVIIAAAIGTIIYTGTNTYYVAFDNDVVAIYQGKPGGVLWLDPQLKERTGITRNQVPEALRSELESRPRPLQVAARKLQVVAANAFGRLGAQHVQVGLRGLEDHVEPQRGPLAFAGLL